jgi:hypothetical protein
MSVKQLMILSPFLRVVNTHRETARPLEFLTLALSAIGRTLYSTSVWACQAEIGEDVLPGFKGACVDPEQPA